MELPSDEYIQVGGSDHNPIWQCILKGRIFEKEYIVRSDSYKRKSDAKQDAACKFLYKLGYTNRESFYTPYKEEKIIAKKTTQSILNREIVFSKPDELFDKSILEIKFKENESLIEWATRKIEKNPYFFFVQLSALFDEISGSAWSAEIDDSALILLNVNVYDNRFFEIGCGSSKTKARIDVGSKMIIKTKILDFLEKKKIEFNIS